MGFVLLLLVLRPGPPPEVLTAAKTALAQILGARVEIVMEEAPRSLTEGEAKSLQAARHATLAASLETLDGDGVQLSLRGAREQVPLRHTLSFDRADAATERGRALGYAIASMLPPAWIAARTAEAGSAHLTARFSVEVAPELGWGVGSSTAPYGGRASFAWRFAERWFAELTAGLRFGTMPSAEATLNRARASLGLARVLREPADGRGLAFVLHAQVGAVRQAAEHLDQDDVSGVHRQTWLPGGWLGLESIWWFSGTAGVCLSAEVEVDGGSVEVYLRDEHKETLGPVSALAALGLRIRF
jgi:hypothetical protein